MKKKNSPAENKKLFNSSEKLPAVADLKARFQQGSVPLEKDFAQLIDMADAGARAAGKAADQNGAGKGMRISETGQLEPNIESFDFTDNANGCAAVKVNSANNQLVVDLDLGLAASKDGLAVKPGKGIKVDKDGVSVDIPVLLPRGLITMFSGTTVPEGWALCDGTNGTPNLVDRFILGGTLGDIGGSNTASFSNNDKNNKTFSVQNDHLQLDVAINNTALTVEQIPEHYHTTYPGYDNSDMLHAGYDRKDSKERVHLFGSKEDNVNNNYPCFPYTSKTGNGQGHNHTGTISGTIDVALPYYILAFIMKL